MSEYVRITERKIELTDEGVEALLSDYTPTTEEVRDCYTSQKMFNDAPDAEFDRWLAEVKAQAWEEGHKTRWKRGVDECHCYAYSSGECACGLYGTGELLSLKENPYQERTSE